MRLLPRLSRATLYLVILGVVVRLLLAPFTICTFDQYPFYISSIDMLSGVGIYGHAYYAYTPLFMVTAYPFLWLLQLVLPLSQFGTDVPSMVDVAQLSGMVTPFVTAPAYNLVIKAPVIIADLLMGLMIFRMVDERWGRPWSERALLFWMLNPLVIWITAVTGQFDVLPALMTVMALMAFHRRSYLLCGLLISLGVFFKIYPAFLGVFYLSVLLVSRYDSNLARFRDVALLAAGALLGLVIMSPFLLFSDQMLEYLGRRSAQTVFGGMNLYCLVPYLISHICKEVVTEGGWRLNPSMLATFVALGGAALLSMLAALRLKGRAITDKGDWTVLCQGNVMVIAAILLTQPVTNPQHMLWTLPFLILLLAKEPRRIWAIAALSVLGALYYLSLVTPAAVLYPLGVYTPIVDVGALNQIILGYHDGGGIMTQVGATALISVAGFLVILGTLLPERYDISTIVGRWLQRRWGELHG